MSLYLRSDAVIANPAGLTASNPLWTPLNNSALALWDGASGVAASGTSITSWTDQVAGIVATGTAGSEPVTGATMNGISAPQFTSAHLSVAWPYNLGAVQLGMFCAVNVLAVNSADADTIISGPGFGLGVKLFNTTSNMGGTAYSNTVQGVATTQIAPHILVIYQDTVDGLIHFRLDGTPIASSAQQTLSALSLGQAIKLGNYYGSGHIDLANTEIGSVGILNGAQSLLSIQKLEGFLAQRFMGTTFLPSSHPYQSVAPRLLT